MGRASRLGTQLVCICRDKSRPHHHLLSTTAEQEKSSRATNTLAGWLRRWGCRRPQVPGQEGNVRRHVGAVLSLSRQEVPRCRVQAAGLSLGDSRLFPAATWAASEGGRHSSLRDWAGGEMRAECSGRRQLGGEMRSHSRGRLQLSGFPGRSQKWAESVRFL